MISYAYCSTIGLVRKNNEDNYLVRGENLPAVNSGTQTVLHGELPLPEQDPGVLAVFDGMGGESEGEVAAWLASEQMKLMTERADIWEIAGSRPIFGATSLPSKLSSSTAYSRVS